MKIRMIAVATVVACLAGAGCATTSPGYGGGYGGGNGNGYGSSCYDCGTVTRIEQGSGSRVPNATGAVVGAVLGGVAGNRIADNRTDSKGKRNSATAAGAIAGAVVGNAIQNRAGTGYNIHVRMGDGRETVVSQDDLGNIREGSSVRVQNGRAYIQ